MAEKSNKKPQRICLLLALLLAYLSNSSAMKMMSVRYSETSVSSYQFAQCQRVVTAVSTSDLVQFVSVSPQTTADFLQCYCFFLAEYRLVFCQQLTLSYVQTIRGFVRALK
jgi:hypothetical protein